MNLTIKQKFSFLFLGNIALGLIVLAIAIPALNNLANGFVQYQENIAERRQLSMEIKSHMGYGGGVHFFKDYLLLGDERDYQRIKTAYKKVDASVQQFKQIQDVSFEELKALSKIENIAILYNNNSDLIKRLFAQGKLTKEISAAIKINDQPALEAFSTLDEHYQQLTKTHLTIVEGEINNAIILLTTIIIGALIFISIIAWLLLFNVMGKIGHVVSAMHEIATGDGNLSRRLTITGDDEIDQLSKKFNAFSSKVQGLVAQLAQASQQIQNLANESSNISSETSSDALLQHQETEQTASAMEEITVSIRSVADHANNAAQAAKNANEHTSLGKNEVEKTIGAIGQLSDGMDRAVDTAQKLANDSQQIGSVLDVIRGIAEQTNLLALNAAIEAARAGEQGRGFAVVADEVRTLASRTQQSTEEIQAMIEKLQVNTTEVVDVIEQGRNLCEQSVTQSTQAGDSLININNTVEQITHLNSEIAVAVNEQSKVTSEIATSVENVSLVSQRTASGAQKSAASSQELATLATSLNGLIGSFRI